MPPGVLRAAADGYAAAARAAADAPRTPEVTAGALGSPRASAAWQRVAAAQEALVALAAAKLEWSEAVLRDAEHRYARTEAAVAAATGGSGRVQAR